MSTTTATTWLAAFALAMLLASSHLLDGLAINIDDRSAEYAQAQDLQLAITSAVQRGRFEAAAQALCGPQAAWQEQADGSVQCRTKHGKPTITVRVSP